MKKLLAILLVVLTVVAVLPATAALAASNATTALTDKTSGLRIRGVIVNDTDVSARPSENSDSIGKVRAGSTVVVTRVERESGSKNVWCYFLTVPAACTNANATNATSAQIEGWTLSGSVSLTTSVIVEKLDEPEEDDQRGLGSRSAPSRGAGDDYEIEAMISGMRYNEDDELECCIYVPPQPGCEDGVEEEWFNENDFAKSSKIITALFKIICSWFS